MAEPEGGFAFGRNQKLPRTLGLAIFSYLSADDLVNASVVSKAFGVMATDPSLWHYKNQV